MITKRTAVISETLPCCNIHIYKDLYNFYEYEIIEYYENKARYECCRRASAAVRKINRVAVLVVPFVLHGLYKKRYRLADDVSQDVFHDSFIVMISNIKAGKFKKQDASLFMYLLGIAKKLVLRRFRTPSLQRWPAD